MIYFRVTLWAKTLITLNCGKVYYLLLKISERSDNQFRYHSVNTWWHMAPIDGSGGKWNQNTAHPWDTVL